MVLDVSRSIFPAGVPTRQRFRGARAIFRGEVRCVRVATEVGDKVQGLVYRGRAPPPEVCTIYMWVWVKTKPPGDRRQVLVDVFIYQGSIWGPYFLPTAMYVMYIGSIETIDISSSVWSIWEGRRVLSGAKEDGQACFDVLYGHHTALELNEPLQMNDQLEPTLAVED